MDDLAGRIAHAWVTRHGAHVSTLDLLSEGLTLITGPGESAWSQAVDALRAPVPVAVPGVDAAAAAVLGIGSAGAVLVGPDAIPISTWREVDTSGLADAINSLVGPVPAHR